MIPSDFFFYQRRTPLNIDDKKNVGEIFNSVTESRPFTNLDQKRCKVFFDACKRSSIIIYQRGKHKLSIFRLESHPPLVRRPKGVPRGRPQTRTDNTVRSTARVRTQERKIIARIDATGGVKKSRKVLRTKPSPG